MISKFIECHRKTQGRSKTWLAEATDIKYDTLKRKFRDDTFTAYELIRISIVLNFDLNELKEVVK